MLSARRRHGVSGIRLAAGVLAIGMLLAGCSAGGDHRGERDNSESSVLRVQVEMDPGCLDPGAVSVVPSIIRGIFDSLTELDPDSGQIVPWLAKSWEINDDATSYTFVLRDDVTFSDGAVFDASVVKGNFDRLGELGLQVRAAAGLLVGYDKSEVIDDHTVRVDFDRPNAGFLQASSDRALGMVSPNSLALDADARCAGEALGSGPFVLDAYESEQRSSIVKRDGYSWGSSARENQGEALVDRVDISVVAESSVRIGNLESGQVDVIDASPQEEAIFEGREDVEIVSQELGGVPVSMWLNHKDPVLKHEEVRRALLVGINRDEIVTGTLSPRYSLATGFLTASQPGHIDLSGQMGYDPEAAQTILDSGGWVLGADGVREKDGQRLATDVIVVGSTSAMELIKQQLSAIGFDLSIRSMIPAQYAEAQNTGTFGISFSARARPDISILEEMFSTGGTNLYGLPSSGLDDLLRKLSTTADPTERQNVAERVQQELLNIAASVPVYELAQVHAISSAVQGMRYDLSGSQLLAEVSLR